MSEPLVSVLLPVRDPGPYLKDCIASLDRQTLSDFEVVAVDDGSTDGSARSVGAWLASKSTPPGWSLIEAPHRGAAAARNTGLGAVRDCERVVFLDSDDTWPMDFLDRALALFDASPGLVGASADRRVVDSTKPAPWLERLSGLCDDPSEWVIRNGSGIGSCSGRAPRYMV